MHAVLDLTAPAPGTECAVASYAVAMVDFDSGPVHGSLDVRWINGSDPRHEPRFQVHSYDEHTYILRQSKTVTYEAPFLYLLFGNERAILFDTGAVRDAAKFSLWPIIETLVAVWRRRNPREAYELVVAHTHAHSDHIAGDKQFIGQPETTVVGVDLDAVKKHFGFTAWPHQVVPYDLGGRVLEVTGIPGHHPTSIAVFDRWTGFLLTGDTVYPGRLYGFDMRKFVASMDHLVTFAEERPVTHVLGCHIEMSTTPGRDYPIGARRQPDEPPLQMTVDQLRAVRRAAHKAARTPGVHVFDDFVIFNGTGRMATVTLLARSLRQRLALVFVKDPSRS